MKGQSDIAKRDMVAGLTEEINEVVSEYEEALLRYATRILKNPDLAQDMVQDAFIRYLKYREGGKEIEKPKAWLYRVTHNLSLDHIRKHSRMGSLDDETAAVVPDKPGMAPDELTDKRDAEALAWDMLKELPEREQQIVTLKVVENKSYKEIAEIMDLTTTNVGFILHTTMKKLAKSLKKSLT